MAKRFNKKQEIKKFIPRKDMVGVGGWKISHNDDAKRYNLTRDDEFHYSHINRDYCAFEAKRQSGVEMTEVK